MRPAFVHTAPRDLVPFEPWQMAVCVIRAACEQIENERREGAIEARVTKRRSRR